jgi:hypothetical protein
MASEIIKSNENEKTVCKNACAAVCLALNGLSMDLPNTALPLPFSSATKQGATEATYASVIPSNLFRPPISLL